MAESVLFLDSVDCWIYSLYRNNMVLVQFSSKSIGSFSEPSPSNKKESFNIIRQKHFILFRREQIQYETYIHVYGYIYMYMVYVREHIYSKKRDLPPFWRHLKIVNMFTPKVLPIIYKARVVNLMPN